MNYMLNICDHMPLLRYTDEEKHTSDPCTSTICTPCKGKMIYILYSLIG